MIAKTLRAAVALAALVSLSACAGLKAVPAGPYASGGNQISVGRTWTDMGRLYDASKGVRMLSIDGPQLNRLFVIDGLKPGEFIIRPASKETPTPTWKAGLTPTEQVEFLADSLVAMQYYRVETENLRPVKVDDRSGVRFDITAQTVDGLNISGIAQLVEAGDRLYILLYLAPTEHYFGATKAEVEGIMASARVGA
ncbi:MAG: hypothetical protein HY859_17605 [Caulobacterales bacterium]|nr:hypothetical protein [Caulobacterales bacterium]